MYTCSFLISIAWLYLVLQGNIGTIWTLFGVSNQLLATMTLAIGTTVIIRMGRRRYAWITGLPTWFMAFISIYADYDNVF